MGSLVRRHDIVNNYLLVGAIITCWSEVHLNQKEANLEQTPVMSFDDLRGSHAGKIYTWNMKGNAGTRQRS
jgi:hypothetical protein